VLSLLLAGLFATASPLAPLLDRIAASARAGRPLVAVAHVALCDNSQVRCGGGGRGDGDDLGRNLYWATSGGFDGWFSRRGSGWTRVARLGGAYPDVLTSVLWRREQAPTPALRARGVTRPFTIYVVAHAWRGGAIDAALERYVRDLWASETRIVRFSDGRELAEGGGAHVVAFLGHNRWMDWREPFPFPADEPDAPAKGAITVACMTAPYVGRQLSSGGRVPLLLTRDFVFAGAAAFEGALLALAEGGDLAAIRARAAASYAGSEGKPYARVEGVFTNPAHKRWLPGGAAAKR
jgi:hypothetical protein